MPGVLNGAILNPIGIARDHITGRVQMAEVTKESGQRKVVDFLRTHNSSGPAAIAQTIETHGALVFLHASEAFKIKRAVQYDYLDYSTLKKRHRMLLRELELNAAAAPTLYRDVVPVTRETDGQLALNGAGTPVEWVLRMDRFPAESELSVVAAAGKIDDPLSEALGTSIAEFHDAAPKRDDDGAELMLEIIEELDRVFADMNTELGSDRIRTFIDGARLEWGRKKPLLQRRSKDGFVRRCHGDLHLGNLVMLNGKPTPYDGLEFDERLGTCDVAYDLAFLLMDLMHLGFRRQANLVLNSYLHSAESKSALEGLAALPLFMAIRAAIRAMVDVQKSRFSKHPQKHCAEARNYLDQAIRYLQISPPMLIAIGGYSGSGKTTVARSVAPMIGAAPGAVHLRSDLIRKAMFGVKPHAKLPRDAYQPNVSRAVYAQMQKRACDILDAGHSVLLDAVHLTEDARAASANIARTAGCAFHGFWLDAPAEVLIARVDRRQGDASDADAKVVRGQLAQNSGKMDWRRVECSSPADDVANAILAALPCPST